MTAPTWVLLLLIGWPVAGLLVALGLHAVKTHLARKGPPR